SVFQPLCPEFWPAAIDAANTPNTGVDLDLKLTYAASMNMVEFRITEQAREAEGILEIGRRMRVSCLEGDRFLVAEEGLAVLDRLGIAYTVLTREPFNYERHA